VNVAAAEIISAPRAVIQRGRPRDPLIDRLRGIVTPLFPELRARRAIENRCFAIHAIGALTPGPWGWIMDDGAAMRGEMKLPFGVLEALGRFRDAALIRVFAQALLGLDPRPAEGMAAKMLDLARANLKRKTEAPR